MGKTDIEWADEVWNYVTGCDDKPDRRGCVNCYARKFADNRLRGRFGYPEDNPFRIARHIDKLGDPQLWKKPRRIFITSMGDLFHKDVPYEWQEHIYLVASMFEQHTYIFLSKRPYEMKKSIMNYCEWYNVGIPGNWRFGISIEGQAEAEKYVPELLKIPARIRFVSVEPLLESLSLKYYLDRINWVICGAETGSDARPMQLDWARDLRDQCRSARVPFFFKKAGNNIETPADLMIREFPV